ncbi:MAG: chorismate synthase [Chitinivibrionales bacterium]|nr:chorismate synthase [Chitinivibrionales bacterium]
MGNSFGNSYRVTTFGESHCKGVGCIIDGCPAGMTLHASDIRKQLNRRRPGQSAISTERAEKDRVILYSGVEGDKTLGTPIMLVVHNEDQRPGDYSQMLSVPRPSHADYTYQMKFGIRASSGGGRASARETIGRVCAGAVAEKFLSETYGTEIVAWVSSVGDIQAPMPEIDTLSREIVDTTVTRCPDTDTATRMEQLIARTKEEKDSIGGCVMCVCRNVPPGLGEPVFDKLEALLAHAMLSLPATKAFEIGSGFKGTTMKGSSHNDMFVKKGDSLGTATNYSGGVLGGISNGEPVVFRVGFKPTATIGKAQKTADFSGKSTVLEARGRHDPCVVNRAVPIIESMAALVLADCALRQQSRR